MTHKTYLYFMYIIAIFFIELRLLSDLISDFNYLDVASMIIWAANGLLFYRAVSQMDIGDV